MSLADPMLDAALDYAGHGWPVFALSGKRPARPKGDGGRGFHDASTDPDTVATMWARYPDANVGIRCGARSGLAVLDVDLEKEGFETLARIETERGPLPHTVIGITGGGGRHRLYQHRAGIGIGTNVFGPGLDLRGEGGYIVAPPSIHPVTGRAYAWAAEGTWSDPLPPWPEQLPLARTTAKSTAAVHPLRHSGQGHLGGLVQFILDAPRGERNTCLNWAAYRAGKHVRSGRLVERQAVAALYAAAMRVGLTHREAVATIASGIRSGRAA